MSSDYSFHPLTWPEAAYWRKQRVRLLITFVLFPLTISAALWAVSLWISWVMAPSAPYQTVVPDWFDNLVINIWGVEIFLSIWLAVVVIQRATLGIAHLRETLNWPLVKIMPYSLDELYRQKAKAIEHSLRWPIRLVLALRVASVVLWVFNTPGVSFTECVLAATFIYVFCAELVVSVRYNSAVGLFASTLAKTTAQANGLAYLLQGLLFLFVFAPFWWNFAQGWPFMFTAFQYTNDTAILSAALGQFAVLAVVQLLMVGLCNSFAVRQAERLIE
jgi:hypothetical protein